LYAVPVTGLGNGPTAVVEGTSTHTAGTPVVTVDVTVSVPTTVEVTEELGALTSPRATASALRVSLLARGSAAFMYAAQIFAGIVPPAIFGTPSTFSSGWLASRYPTHTDVASSGV
jgi:hypothetical protein